MEEETEEIILTDEQFRDGVFVWKNIKFRRV